MKSDAHFLTTEKTGIVITCGNGNAKNILLVLHGYGQLAETFQNEFSKINLEEYFLVFPTALNHFYLKAGKGDVGASWMTKYFRENDIHNNNVYLSKVYQTFILPKLNPDKKFNVLGFSQGAATLVRWLAMNNIQPHQIILWGAVFPPDMESEEYLNKLKKLHWLYFIGTDDEFISNEEKQKQMSFFKQNQFNLQWIEYNGKHQLNFNILQNYIK